jgi:glutamate synthase (NADPH/NADH) small chain
MTIDSAPVDQAALVRQYLAAQEQLDATREQLSELAKEDATGTFDAQVTVLKRHLAANPRAFTPLFINDGMSAIAAEFEKGDLSKSFINAFWDALLRDDDGSTVLMRFIWYAPLRLKRTFIRALDTHMRDRYPFFEGLSENWPAGNNVPPYTRPAEERATDFELVNTGYLGYLDLGYSRREVDLLVWLEAVRDKQCAESECQLGAFLEDGTKTGGCPVQIEIPKMLDLLGEGKFREALELLESCNPLPSVTGRVCPQELQCQGVCAHQARPIEIGQIEWFLPAREKLYTPEAVYERYGGRPDPWETATKPPIAIVGSGPSGLINAFLLAVEGYPVTVFEAFHALGGVLRYGIPEFRLPNELIDDVVEKIELLGGKFVKDFVVGKSASLDDLRDAGFFRIYVGSGAGLPTFMNVPGEDLVNVMSANEFLTRVNLMQGHRDDYESPLPEVAGKNVIVIGGGNTAMDAARTALRLGGHTTIVYRRDQDAMPARVEELHHALEEGVHLRELRAPAEFLGDKKTHFVKGAVLDVMQLGEPDESGRRSPKRTGEQETIEADLVIMALGNGANPIIKDSQPDLSVNKWGAIVVQDGSQETSVPGVFSGGDATRGGSTAILAAGDGQAAAHEMAEGAGGLDPTEIAARVESARKYTELASTEARIVDRIQLTDTIVEFVVHAPVIARAAQAGQFVRVLGWPDGELIPLTLADWDAEAGTITIVIQQVGTSTIKMNAMQVGDVFEGVAGPLGLPSDVRKHGADETVVFTAGGLGLPPAYPIARAHLQTGNHVTMIVGFRSESLLFWNGEGQRLVTLKEEFGDQVDIIYTSDDGSFGIPGLVTGPLQEMLDDGKRKIAEVVTIGPARMMAAVADVTRPYGVPTAASVNSIMVDATGMCGACMVPFYEDGKLVRKHACIDGPELDAHAIDWEKFLPRFNQFQYQERLSLHRANLTV